MLKAKNVVLGGGMVAGYLAKELMENGLQAGELTIISAEKEIPYERPPLSKGFLAGTEQEEKIRINPADVYRDKGIDIRLGLEATAVDPASRTIRFRSGEDVWFENLVLATGAEPIALHLPEADLQGIHYLRSLDDSKNIRDKAAEAKHAVVVGGGFISMETAAVLAAKGIDTTIVMRDDRVWSRFFTPRMSEFFEGYFSAHGVKLVKQSYLIAAGGNGQIASVTLSGGRTIACDILVVGIGVKPAIGYLKDSGIETGDGVMVNEYLETSAPGVYAAGDIANYYDAIYKKRRRVEHWDNAVSQGRHCAQMLLGKRAPFVHVPYFFSDVFDLSYEFWGETTDADKVVERGDLRTSSFSVWWLKQKRLIGAFVMSRPDEERTNAPEWIQAGSAGDLL